MSHFIFCLLFAAGTAVGASWPDSLSSLLRANRQVEAQTMIL